MSTDEEFISIIRQRLNLQYRPCGVQWAVFKKKKKKKKKKIARRREENRGKNSEWQTAMNQDGNRIDCH